MSSLQLPIRSHLREPSSEAELHHVWKQITDIQIGGGNRRSAPRSHISTFLVSMSAVSLAFLLLWPGVTSRLSIFQSMWPFGSVSSTAPSHGQLETMSGELPIVLGNPSGMEGEIPKFWHFADGSHVRVGEETDLQVMVNDELYFVMDLSEGRATFSIEQGGTRHWIIQAGDLSVESTGAQFRLTKSSDRVEVTVDKGNVFVKGERLPEHIRHVEDGETFTVLLEPHS